VLVLAGLLGAVTIPCFALGLRPPPALLDDGAAADLSHQSAPREVVASARFWLLTTAYLLNAVTTFAVAVHIVAYLRAHGLSGSTAASALGAIGLVQVLGRSTFTRLSARRAAIEVGTWALAAKAVGLAFLLLIPGWAGIVLFIAIYGSANGIGTLTRAMTVAELYGAEHYGTISSIIAAVSAIGGALAPFGAAAAIDLVGRDAPVFWALAALCALAAIINRGVAASHGRFLVLGPFSTDYP
jgi:MFS family permease